MEGFPAFSGGHFRLFGLDTESVKISRSLFMPENQRKSYWIVYIRNAIPVSIHAWKSKKKLWNSSHFFCVKLDYLKFEVLCLSGSRTSPLSIEKTTQYRSKCYWTFLTLINVEVGPKRPTFNNFFTQNKNAVQWYFQFFPTITVRPTILTWT
jgi:hypothetical protein